MIGKKVIFRGGFLIDGNGGEPIENSIVVINGDKIEKIGRDSKETIPKDAKEFDISGKTIMPGLIDAHTHISSLSGGMNIPADVCKDYTARRALKAYINFQKTLKAGFTTVREAGAVAYIDVAYRDLVNLGEIDGPRVIAAGKGINITGGHAELCSHEPWIKTNMGGIDEVADGRSQCRRAVRNQVRMGVDFIKIFATSGIYDAFAGGPRREFSDEELKVLVEEAHVLGRKVAAHAHSPEAIIACLKVGVDSIEHGMFMNDECLELMKKKNAYWVLTCSIMNNLANGASAGVIQSAVINAQNALNVQKKAFHRALEIGGVNICVGTDTGACGTMPGDNAYELELLNRWGLSEMNCIIAATKTNAELLGIIDKVGTIEKGKYADIIVVDKNPLKDIKILRNKEKIKLVMIGGKIVKNII